MVTQPLATVVEINGKQVGLGNGPDERLPAKLRGVRGARLVTAAQHFAQGRAKPLQDGGPLQTALQLGRLAGQDLLSQVFVDLSDVAMLAGKVSVQIPPVAQCQAEHAQANNPPLPGQP